MDQVNSKRTGPHKPRGRPFTLLSVARVLIDNAEYVLQQWLPDGELVGDEFKARNPTRDDQEAGSFSINIDTGLWADFATDDRGSDLVSLYQYLQGEEDVAKVLSDFAKEHGLSKSRRGTRKKAATRKKEKPPTEPIKEEDLQELPPDCDREGNPVVGSWEYRNPAGEIVFYACRLEPEPGKKDVKPVRFVPSQSRWVWGYPEGKRPLFNSDMIESGARVLFSEGEKTASHLCQFPSHVSTTSSGGSGRLLESDLSPLKKALAVLVFPDADDPGAKYAAQVLAYCAIHELPAKILDVEALGWSGGEDAADHSEMSMSDYEPHLLSPQEWTDLSDSNRDLFDTAVFQVAGSLDGVEYDRKRELLVKLLGIGKRTLDAKVKEYRQQEYQGPSEELEEEPTAEELAEYRESLYPEVAHIAEAPDILKLVRGTLQQMGVVEEAAITDLSYLAVTSRLLKKPINLIVKGSSSSGKSFTTQTTIRLFPEGAYYTLSGGSAKSLIYTQEDFSHRTLVILEATLLNGASDDDPFSMFLRTLISEGYIRYETVEKNEEGQLETRVVVKEGPTGLILTTTADLIHHENETRMLSAYPNESVDQTRAIVGKIAKTYANPMKEEQLERVLETWHTFHDWVSLGNHDVIIPFMFGVVEDIQHIPVRFRRDISQLGSLIQASTIIHQATRETDEGGYLIATLEDYRIARDVILQSLQISANEALTPKGVMILQHIYNQMTKEVRGGEGALKISSRKIATALGIPQRTVAYQAKKMVEHGYLRNVEQFPGRPMRLKLGDDFSKSLLGAAAAVLPIPEELKG